MSVFRLLWRILRGAFLVVAAIIFYLEEWGWRPLTAWAARITSWPPLARLETRIRGASPNVALTLFGVPAVLLIPVKLLALWFIHRGETALGIGVIVAAKLTGTALVGRLFIITEPQLMQFPRFAQATYWWRATKLRVKERAKAAVRRLRYLLKVRSTGTTGH